MSVPIHDPEWAKDGRIVELNFSGALGAGDDIDGTINGTPITTVSYSGSDSETLTALATEIRQNRYVQDAVAGTNKVTVTGYGKTLELTSFAAVGGNEPTITQNETNAGTADAEPPSTSRVELGYLSGEKPSQKHFNYLFKLWADWILAIKNGDIGVALKTYDTKEDLKAEAPTLDFTWYVKDLGFGYYDSTATDDPDDENVIQHDAVPGRSFLTIQNWDAIATNLEVFIAGLELPNSRGLKIWNLLSGGLYADGAALESDLNSDVRNVSGLATLFNNEDIRAEIIADSAMKTIVQNSTTANDLMEGYEGPGY